MVPLLVRVLLVDVIVVLCALCLLLFTKSIKSTSMRLFSVLPLLAINCVLPRLFDSNTEFITRGCHLLLLTWLSNFKAFGYALNRGPLCLAVTNPQFIAIYFLPITPQIKVNKDVEGIRSGRLEESAGDLFLLFAKFMGKLVCLCAIVYVLAHHDRPVLLTDFGKGFCLYWFLGVLMDGSGLVLGWMLQLPISPHFDAPYISRSIAQFWAKRWNLTVGNALRFLAFDPISEGRLVKTAEPVETRKWRTALAVCWTFIVSGLMHEIIIWHLDRSAMTGEWLAFFALQGPVVLLERALLKWLQRVKLAAPPWLATAQTLLTLLLMAHFLFFPPAARSHLDQKFFSSVRVTLAQLTGVLTGRD